MKNFDQFVPDVVVASPGRINLIGEHTDYNDGFVLPTAVDKKIKLSLKVNGTRDQCTIYSKNYDTCVEINLRHIIGPSKKVWENYILGVLDQLLQRSNALKGFDCVIESDLPMGSGMSSSAALECGLVFGLNELFELGLSKLEIAQLSQAAEHEFVGTKCGIMDQYASVMSKAGHVLLLDCKTLEHVQIPLKLSGYQLLLINTKVSHSLADSEYNLRREECERGVALIQQQHPEVRSLRTVTLPMLEAVKGQLPTKVYQRCQYVIKENERVLAAVEALKSNQLNIFGQLMYQSHRGLQHQYNVSCAELDFLVDFSENKEYILGARMMGGGFGGCTINLIRKDMVNNYIEEVSSAYERKFNIQPDAFKVLPSGGTQHKLITHGR